MTKKYRTTGSNNYWRFYRKIFKNDVTEVDYRVILNAYFDFIIQKVLEGHTVTLPARMGKLVVKSWKQKKFIFDEDKKKFLNKRISWARTRTYWRENPEAAEKKVLLYCSNYETNDTVSKIIWEKDKILEKEKIFFYLSPARSFKLALQKKILKGQEYESRFC